MPLATTSFWMTTGTCTHFILLSQGRNTAQPIKRTSHNSTLLRIWIFISQFLQWCKLTSERFIFAPYIALMALSDSWLWESGMRGHLRSYSCCSANFAITIQSLLALALAPSLPFLKPSFWLLNVIKQYGGLGGRRGSGRSRFFQNKLSFAYNLHCWLL